jgi:hypothetical protein
MHAERCAGFVHRENYHAVTGTDVDLLKHPVAVGAAEAAYRVAEKVPVFGPLMPRRQVRESNWILRGLLAADVPEGVGLTCRTIPQIWQIA